MRVVGATIVRDALRLDYPITQAVRSILPLVDLVVVNVGRSDDGTLGHLRTALGDENVVFLDREWDSSAGGSMLADETRVAMHHTKADWVVYVQADEVLHENGVESMRAAMERHREDAAVEGLLVNFLHHYGNPDSVATARTWYRREARAIKPESGVRSFHEAQGFRSADGRHRIRAAPSGATYHHYGWARPREALREKATADFAIYGRKKPREFLHLPWEYGLQDFAGSHPAIMADWISSRRGRFVPVAPPRWTGRQLRLLGSSLIERATGWRPFEYRNYEVV